MKRHTPHIARRNERERQPAALGAKLLRRLNDQSGSAMTEFIIGLPVFVLIFSGMGALHSLNSNALASRMKTIQALSLKTSAVNNVHDFVSSDVHVGPFSFGSGEDSIYQASAQRATIGSQLGPIASPAAPPKSTIEEITGGENNFANNLLTDTHAASFDTSGGFLDAVRSFINFTGTNPSIGAGIRYVNIDANESHSFEHPWVGSMTYNPGTVGVAAPTAATHRAFPVLISRLEMNSREPYRNSLLVFDTGVESSDMINPGTPFPGAGGLDPGIGEECQAEYDPYISCMQDPGVEQQAADSRCGFAGHRQCTVEDLCKNLKPNPNSTCGQLASGSQGTDQFHNNNMCQPGECAQPSGTDRGWNPSVSFP